MSTPPPIPKTHPNKGSPPKISLEILYDYMELVEKKREERDAKIQIELVQDTRYIKYAEQKRNARNDRITVKYPA
jgi:hypothetical protein